MVISVFANIKAIMDCWPYKLNGGLAVKVRSDEDPVRLFGQCGSFSIQSTLQVPKVVMSSARIFSCTSLQSQKAVTAYLKSKQLLPSGFARQCTLFFY